MALLKDWLLESTIHSSKDQDNALAAIKIRNSEIWGKSDIFPLYPDEAWIGLSRNILSRPNVLLYSWVDGSVTDYGSNGSFFPSPPWNAGRPLGGLCVRMQSNGQWIDVNCNSIYGFKALCNHCDGIINKYAMWGRWNSNKSTALTDCVNAYGQASTLASIHSDRDRTESEKIMNIYNESQWIGLSFTSSSDVNTYLWSDGTTFDYGSQFFCHPQGLEFGSNCVAMMGGNCWDGLESCSNRINPLCTVPSELHNNLNVWQNFGWNYANGEYVQLPSSSARAILNSTQWYNGDQPLKMDYMFSIDFGPSASASEIRVYNGASTPLNCYWYGIGIEKTKSEEYQIYLSRSNGDGKGIILQDGSNGNVRLTDRVLQDFTESTFHLLSIEISKAGDRFIGSVNNEQYFTYQDNLGHVATLNDGFSGFIGLYSDKHLVTTAKYLYISGEPIEWNKPGPDHRESCRATTAGPTSETGTPSSIPTRLPTLSPTYVSSYMPTYRPTTSPSPHSNAPTSFPSKLPSQSPSGFPSISPTLITSSPSSGTGNPSISPSGYPTITPSIVPSANPSEFPTIQNPSTFPTYTPSLIPTTSPSVVPSRFTFTEPSFTSFCSC